MTEERRYTMAEAAQLLRREQCIPHHPGPVIAGADGLPRVAYCDCGLVTWVPKISEEARRG